MAFDLIAELEALVDALAREQVEYAICGGLALALHGHPRATMDIDLLVPPTHVAAAMCVAATLGFDVAAQDDVRVAHRRAARGPARVEDRARK